MYRPDEMAMILEQAKQYTNSQRLAYTKKKVLTYDGNPDNRRLLLKDEGVYITHVSSELIDLNSVVRMSLTFENGNTITSDITEETARVDKLSNLPCLYGYLDEITAPAILQIPVDLPDTDVGHLSAGTYLCSYDNGIMAGYISRIEYGETIHPIPQEYIPPLDRLILNGTDGNQYALSVDSSGQLVVEEVTE